jgi:PadR family transcriptional regulator PadR
MSKESKNSPKKTDILQGTLDLMILQALDALGPLHGYGVARRIEQVSESALQLNEGTVYTARIDPAVALRDE